MLEAQIKWKTRTKKVVNVDEDDKTKTNTVWPETAAFVDGMLKSSFYKITGVSGASRWLVMVFGRDGYPMPTSVHEVYDRKTALLTCTQAALGQFPVNLIMQGNPLNPNGFSYGGVVPDPFSSGS